MIKHIASSMSDQDNCKCWQTRRRVIYVVAWQIDWMADEPSIGNFSTSTTQANDSLFTLSAPSGGQC